MRLTEHDKRALGAIHRGAAMPKTSNFDQSERRLEKLKAAGLVADAHTLTNAGRDTLRDYYRSQGWADLASRV